MVLDVLVVDDSDVIRTMILKTLRLAKVPLGTAYEASNGREALDLMEDNWVDLVLADINMPVMDGIEMVDHMRESADLANIPVIIVSTEGNSSRIEDLQRKGIAAYVRKPFTPELLRDVVSGVTADWTRDDHATLVGEVFQSVLERFTFMYGEPVDKSALIVPEEPRLLARMTFSGAIEGAMGLAAPVSLCAEMAANLLGDEPERQDMRVLRADALGEVLNIACGHVATALEVDRATDLAPPVVAILPDDDWDRMAAAPHTFGFIIEGRPALLSLGVRPPK